MEYRPYVGDLRPLLSDANPELRSPTHVFPEVAGRLFRQQGEAVYMPREHLKGKGEVWESCVNRLACFLHVARMDAHMAYLLW